MNLPAGMVVNAAGSLFLADSGNSRVLVFDNVATPVTAAPSEQLGSGPQAMVLGNGSRTPRVRVEGHVAVRVEAFDVLGRSVGMLVNGDMVGTVERALPPLAPGLYLVRVEAGGRAASHAVVVR